MHESWSTAPRVTNFDDADVTELERIRQASKADYANRGLKLTSMPFVIKAVALALKQNPTINAAIDEVNEQIIYKQYVNLGIAVDTERGLVVPSMRRPDEMGIADIARVLGNVADNARNNNFKLEDLRGSTFTISNLGAVGGTYSTPIINIPEVAILLLGRSRKLPVVMKDDQNRSPIHDAAQSVIRPPLGRRRCSGAVLERRDRLSGKPQPAADCTLGLQTAQE